MKKTFEKLEEISKEYDRLEKTRDKRRIIHFELAGDLYVENIEQATNVIMKIEQENKKCFILKHISIQD